MALAVGWQRAAKCTATFAAGEALSLGDRIEGTKRRFVNFSSHTPKASLLNLQSIVQRGYQEPAAASDTLIC
jgi:hypothetical protein